MTVRRVLPVYSNTTAPGGDGAFACAGGGGFRGGGGEVLIRSLDLPQQPIVFLNHALGFEFTYVLSRGGS